MDLQKPKYYPIVVKTSILAESLQKMPGPPSVRRMQISSLGSNIPPPPFEKFWLHAWLVEGMQIVSDWMQSKSLIFVTLYNFICRITFNSSLVLDPLESEITINLEFFCPSPINCIFSVVSRTS